ncbi:HAD-IA family hydrolase [Gulosibacter faecalis]|uniref:HAD-IA family hydrolase n=1 Tax=Gulosibacter faecalis TaxID=272240 RepID=A0ABW5UWE9_9MICO|nr:HAD-IA family hydrolase [Gulosibacter faecalis]
MTAAASTQRLDGIRAFLLDLDGVITPTAEIHRRAWSSLFTAEFAKHGVAPYTERDYFEHLDGKPRFDGVRDTLASRGIELPEGSPDDTPDAETVGGLGNRKNAEFARLLAADGIAAYPGSLEFLRAIAATSIRTAVVTSSRNGRTVLEAAGLGRRFTTIIDGVHAAELGLPGKPAPDTYLQAARELDVPAAECAVVEDAESGVASGAAGGFGAVIGVDRGAGHDALRANGATLVVDDLADLIPLLTPTGKGTGA